MSTQAECGELVIGVDYDSPADQVGRLRINHAPTAGLVPSDLLDLVRSGAAHPDCSTTGDLLTISASNRTVVYRIGEYDPQQRAHWCHLQE